MAAAARGGFGAPLLVQAEIDPGEPSPLRLCCPNSQDLVSTSEREPGWGLGPGSWVGGRAKEGLSHSGDSKALGKTSRGVNSLCLGGGGWQEWSQLCPEGWGSLGLQS